MRKWMRDRLKRRKKTEEAPPSQPAPLQPAYFEAEQQPQVTTAPGPEEEVQPPEEPQADVESEAAREGAEGTPLAGAGEKRPRRRRRGGRGRRRSAPKPLVVPAEP